MNTVIGTSIGGACIIYEIVAVLGYLTFGSKVGANIMAMYPATSLFIACGQLAIVILVLFSYPLQVHPCRNCLDKIVEATTSKKILRPARPENGETTPVIDEELDYEHPLQDAHSPARHATLTAAIIICGFTIAYFVSSLQLGKISKGSQAKRCSREHLSVLSFVGSTGSTTISFILPGLFFAKLFQEDPKERLMVLLAKVLTVYGLCVFVFW